MSRLHDHDVVQPGDVVYIVLDEAQQRMLHLPKRTQAYVRGVIDRKKGALSVRIPFNRVPSQYHSHHIPDPHAPGYIPLVVVAGEWELSQRSR